MVMEILSAVLVLGGMGGGFGLLLAVAARLLAVKQDPRLESIIQELPGANCGGCGFAGCSTFAQAMLDGNAEVNGCPVGGEKLSAKLAELLGVETKKNTRLTALVRCSGGVRAQKKFEYSGLQDCVAAMKLGAGGPMECPYGCIGLGTCVGACQFGAISVIDGVAVVDHERCTGCLKCTRACPKKIIVPIPYYADVVVACSSTDKGSVLRQVCNIGCLGCRICERVCQHDAIKVTDSLATIDYEKCTGCGDCAEKCPRKLIIDANLDSGPRLFSDAE